MPTAALLLFFSLLAPAATPSRLDQALSSIGPATTIQVTVNPEPTSTLRSVLAPLADLVAKGESTTMGGYNAANRGRASDLGRDGLSAVFGGRDCSEITIGEILLAQGQRRLHAAGRYQIIGITMPMAVRSAGLSGADMFSPENQDRLFLALLKNKRPLVWLYINGLSGNGLGAADAMSREWSSIAYWDGRSYYGGGDRAHVSREEILSELEQTRERMRSHTQHP
ncbi:hypothetical protein [Synechococcus sp. SYN20]|uniref:hypothetical protein n=1 Tax=Synechococcus sp. SYN20 TaxID=1050714 RepID=UPI001645FE32|nr:hypothetical protein [Synechococcus sp. SYN20]